ncbi:MAG: hypothetical protein OXM55_01430 [Bdellovibrionales bacterium]|nr:hypothetical protein [Bdellovibrionales bacterium]
MKKVYGGSYTIKKDSDKLYSVNLIIEFFPDSTYEGPVAREKVPDYYMEKVQSCMQDANKKMLGPNGETLRINIRGSSKSDDCGIKKTNVGIRSPNERSGVLHYSSNVDCPTILHEILHLLGLPDEYGGDYNLCRVDVPESIMSNSNMRWDSVFISKTRNSLLDSVHFSSILHKNCAEKNRLYDECLHKSIDWPKEECEEKKNQCELKNLTGRNKQQEIEIITGKLKEARQNLHEEQKTVEENRKIIERLIKELSTGKHGEKGKKAVDFWKKQLKQLDDLRHPTMIKLEERLKIVKSW